MCQGTYSANRVPCRVHCCCFLRVDLSKRQRGIMCTALHVVLQDDAPCCSLCLCSAVTTSLTCVTNSCHRKLTDALSTCIAQGCIYIKLAISRSSPGSLFAGLHVYCTTLQRCLKFCNCVASHRLPWTGPYMDVHCEARCQASSPNLR